MSDEDVIALQLKHLNERIDTLAGRLDRFDDHVRNGVKVVLLGALYVLWEPVKRLWEAMR